MKIFFDMDGTLAKFYEKPNSVEHMYEKGFFANLKPYKIVQKLANLKNYNSIYILSACIDSPYCKQEKIEWIKKYLPTFPICNVILCNVGENKSKVVENLERENNENYYLIDDYSKNLIEWSSSGPRNFSIKFKNGINCKKHKYNEKVCSLKAIMNIILEYEIGKRG